MVAYSFKERFIAPIETGTKRQTVRADGKRRHARPGEDLQLYYAMRTKQCRLIRRARCIDVAAIRLRFQRPDVILNYGARAIHYAPDAFAREDGFKDWADLCAFWEAEHGALHEFEGTLIRWAP
jgi:hypothetical protein